MSDEQEQQTGETGQTVETSQTETKSRTPDDMFAVMDTVVESVNALPDKIVEAMKQAGGVTKAQETAAKDAAQDTATKVGETAQQGETDQRKTNPRSFTDWWFN